MQIFQEAIEDFRRIWKDEFGEEISHDEAETRGKELVHLFEIIYRPLPIQNHDMPREKRKEDLPQEAKSEKDGNAGLEPESPKGQMKLL